LGRTEATQTFSILTLIRTTPYEARICDGGVKLPDEFPGVVIGTKIPDFFVIEVN
jgi:hypothetical protein